MFMFIKKSNFFQNLKKNRLFSLILHLINQQKRNISDYLGSIITRNWNRAPGDSIIIGDPHDLEEVLQIYHSLFDGKSDRTFRHYSKIFKHIFYLAKSESEIVGYCVYYIKPFFSLTDIKKVAVLYSIGIKKEYQSQGIGKKLLLNSIQEMKLNNIAEIILFVNVKNIYALALYKSLGFKIFNEIDNVCGDGERCYDMRLSLL